MANVKITQLPSATTPLTGTEVFPLVQGTTTKQVAITGLFTSPVMSNPTLGVVGQADLINATGLPISSGVAGLGTGIATFLGTPSSANLRTAVTDETGTGSLVFANTPVLVAPNLGTPTFLIATNATGTAVGLTAGSAITNANLTGAVTSVGNATSLGSFTSAQLRTALTDETGAGSAVFATSPTITAPILNQINDTNNAQILGLLPTTSAVDYLVVKNGTGVGVPLHFYADGSSANIGLHIQPKGTGLVTISDGTDFNKGIRFRSSGSAASAVTLLDAVSTAGRVVTLPDATTTLVGRDTTDTLTNKTIAFSSNTFSGTLAIANGGTNASTAALAIENLLPAYAGNGSKGLKLNSGATALEWVADGGGTVTNVAASVPSFLSIAGSPITTSGTLAISLSGTALPTTSGGTGLTSFTSGGVVYASSTSALATGSALVFDGTAFGVGITPSAWVAGYSVLQVGKASWYTDGNGFIQFASNTFQGSGFVDRYIGSTYANKYEQSDGHKWYTAASGTAGNAISFTQAMNLTAGGLLGIGQTSPVANLDIKDNVSDNASIGLQTGTSQKFYITAGITGVSGNIFSIGRNSGGTTPDLALSGGNLGIGTSSPAKKLDVSGTIGVSGVLTSTVTSALITDAISGDTNALYHHVKNTGGEVYFGLNNSSNAGLITGGGTYATCILNPLASNIAFGTDGQVRMRILAAGGVQAVTTISVGDATPATSGAGITFPADATVSASSNANTLDDYEEGTFVPTVTFGGASVGVTYNTTFTGATYTKIGNRVCVSGYILLTNKGSSSGDASIGNLPFQSEAGTTKYLGASFGGVGFTFANQFWSRIAPTSTTIDLFETTEAGVTTNITNSDFTNDAQLYFSATYTF